MSPLSESQMLPWQSYQFVYAFIMGIQSQGEPCILLSSQSDAAHPACRSRLQMCREGHTWKVCTAASA